MSVLSVCVFSVTVSRGLMMLLEEERLCSCGMTALGRIYHEKLFECF